MQEGKKHVHGCKDNGMSGASLGLHHICYPSGRGQRWRLEKWLYHLWRSLDSEPRSVDGRMNGWLDDGWLGRWVNWMDEWIGFCRKWEPREGVKNRRNLIIMLSLWRATQSWVTRRWGSTHVDGVCSWS